jgi:SWI/SNF-related matrix-associated actin-dependent regulator 1 of chromatin subfamily A
LPEKIYSEVDLPLNAEVKKLLRAEESMELDVDYLVSGKPAIGEYATMRRELGLLKIGYCREHIQDIVDQAGAVVVFTYHQELAKSLAKEFNTEPVIGSTPNRVRTKIVSDFQNVGGVFVGSYGAAGTGITLTKASHVVLCELEYSPRLIDQAVDRCHRIGQTNTVNVYTLLWSKGLERNLWKQLQDKDETFQNLFN